jgi:hypothetical protein
MANWGTELRRNPAHQPKASRRNGSDEDTARRHQERTRNHPASSSLDRRAVARRCNLNLLNQRAPTARARQPPAKKPNLRARSKAEAATADRILHQKVSFFQGPGGVGRGAARGERRKASGCGSPLLSPPLNNEAQSKRGDGERGKGGRGIRRIKIEAFAALRCPCAALRCPAPPPRRFAARPTRNRASKKKKITQETELLMEGREWREGSSGGDG